MQEFIVRVGPMNSLNSLYSYLGPAIKEIRNNYIHGNFLEVKFDLTGLTHQRINISALTAFISTSKKIREALGQPMELLFRWEPNIFAFLTDIGFFAISKKLDIFFWDELMIGGFRSGVTNPNTKIIYFSDKHSMSVSDNMQLSELMDYKSSLKQKIVPNFILRCSEILSGFNNSLINTVTNSSIELIVNALVHGQDIAIVGLQRSSKRITVSVSDGGIGFRKSLIKTYGEEFEKIDQAQALIIGSLIQKKEHGLRLAIDEVLNFSDELYFEDLLSNEGWVIMSTVDCEVRWQKTNWKKAKMQYDSLENLTDFPKAEKFLDEPVSKIFNNNYEVGYWKLHPIGLVGTRVTFEIPLYD